MKEKTGKPDKDNPYKLPPGQIKIILTLTGGIITPASIEYEHGWDWN